MMRLVTFLPKTKKEGEMKIGVLLGENSILDLRAAAAF
jgi:hypothetical protein